MKVSLIGSGCGSGTLTAEARAAIDNADLLLGSKRLLEEHAAGKTCLPAVSADDLCHKISESGCEKAAVLFSGDSGFFSGARGLLPLLNEADAVLLPGISSVQVLAARLGRLWQDWALFSAHGTDCDPVSAVCGGKPAFFLTGGKLGPAELCRELRDAGLGSLPVTVGECLGSPEERIRRGSADSFSEEIFPALSVMLAEAAPGRERRAPGFPDELFERREHIPMTKQEVRAVALAKLAVGPSDLCWDIGTGTGSVAIELAMQCRKVFGIERSPEALTLAERNRVRLGAWNLHLTEGCAPEALAGLPAPDAVFLGGSGGRMEEILKAVHSANPGARVCVSAIALESLHTALTVLEELGYETNVTELSVSRSRNTAALHMMLAQNPVFLILGRQR